MQSLKEEDKNITYPILMQSTISKFIVLFKDYGEGTIVYTEELRESAQVGHWSDNWIMHYFVPFSGKITLSN